MAATEPLSYWDYVKAAFWRRIPVPLLGRMPLNQMALVVLGLAGIAINPGFLLLGAALEVAYVGWLSSNASFQKLVQGERLLGRQSDFNQRVHALAASLSGDLRERYRRLYLECSSILGLRPATEEEAGTLADVRSGSLNQLLWLFLRLLASRDSISATLARTDRTELEADVTRLEERLAQAPADSALARSVQATLDIQRKRLENLTRAASSLEVVDAELERIERQVGLIREEAAVSGGPEAVSVRLDAVTATLSETSRWMDQNADILGSLAGDDLDAAALPRLPEAPVGAAPPPPPPQRVKQRG